MRFIYLSDMLWIIKEAIGSENRARVPVNLEQVLSDFHVGWIEH